MYNAQEYSFKQYVSTEVAVPIYLMRHFLFIDVLLLLLSAWFITGNVDIVPLHGDEPTVIWMSKDYQVAILDANPGALAYKPPPQRTTEQHLRILNSTVSRVVLGVAWSSTGFSVEDINDQWVWGADTTWNRDNGHIPSPRLLKISRLTMAWITVLAGVFVLATTRLLAHHILRHRWGVYGASWGALALFTLNPSILINGRRAMFEASLLLGLAVVSWGVSHNLLRYTSYRAIGWLGLVTGLALSTKHSTVFGVVGLFALWLLLGVWSNRRSLDGKQLLQIRIMSGTTLVAIVVFFLINPIWWSSPLKMPGIILEERQALLDIQVGITGGYKTVANRWQGLWDETVHLDPQSYEFPDWIGYPNTRSEITRYEASPLKGLGDSPLGYGLRYLLLACGIGQILYVGIYGRGKARQATLLLGGWLAWLVGLNFVTIPVAWQRYYLPMQIPLVMVMGLGVGTIVYLIVGQWQNRQVAVDDNDEPPQG